MSLSFMTKLYLRQSSKSFLVIYELLEFNPFKKYKSSYILPFIILFLLFLFLLLLLLLLGISMKVFFICSNDIFNKDNLFTSFLKAFCSL